MSDEIQIIAAEIKGTMRFKRVADGSRRCVCCPDGNHVFCRFIDTKPDLFDWANQVTRSIPEGSEVLVSISWKQAIAARKEV